MKIYGIELETPLIKGDANADKKVNAADIIEVANAIVSKPSENHSTFSRVVQQIGYGYSCNHVTAEGRRKAIFYHKQLIITCLHDILSCGYRKKVTWLQL